MDPSTSCWLQIQIGQLAIKKKLHVRLCHINDKKQGAFLSVILLLKDASTPAEGDTTLSGRVATSSLWCHCHCYASLQVETVKGESGKAIWSSVLPEAFWKNVLTGCGALPLKDWFPNHLYLFIYIYNNIYIYIFNYIYN